MTIHTGGDCWEILRGGQKREEVTEGHSEVLPSLVWVISHFFLIVPSISQTLCSCAEEFYVPTFISFPKPTPLLVHVLSHDKGLSPLLFFLLQLSPVSATSSLSHLFPPHLHDFSGLSASFTCSYPSLPYTQY